MELRPALIPDSRCLSEIYVVFHIKCGAVGSCIRGTIRCRGCERVGACTAQGLVRGTVVIKCSAQGGACRPRPPGGGKSPCCVRRVTGGHRQGRGRPRGKSGVPEFTP